MNNARNRQPEPSTNLKNSPEESSKNGIGEGSIGSVLKMTEKYGVSLVLLLIVGYGGFNYVIFPIASRFADSIDRVSAVNEDLRDKITDIATANGASLRGVEAKIEDIRIIVDQLERYFLAKSANETQQEVQYPVQQYSQRRRWRR